MKLSDILVRTCVKVPLAATEKTAAITELVDLLAAAGQVRDRDVVLNAVLTREQARSTGIGKGLAVPHGKSTGCAGLVMAVGKPARLIDFDSIDGKPVDLIVLLASPRDKTGPHIQALARISRLMLMEHFRQAVDQAATPDDLFRVMTEGDE
jgi:fructose-specific phosphotransferase system IIA component